MRHLQFLAMGFVILLLNCSPKNISPYAQRSIEKSPLQDTSLSVNYIFPDDWLGQWSGDLKIYNAQGLKQTVPMTLDLSKTDTSGVFCWAIIYGQDSTAQLRDYQLKEIDSSKGHYIIDEKNGILLDAYHIHNELSSIFEVMGNTLFTSYKRVKNEMIFSVNVFPSKEIRMSGDTIIESQEIPKVSSFQHTVSQFARLQKKCLVE